MQCLTLALENPPEIGEYRVFNQFAEVYDVTELAEKVKKVAAEFDLDPVVRNLTNPRRELEEHYYNPDHKHLFDLGYEPTHDVEAELRIMLSDLIRHADRIEAKRETLIPDVLWDGRRQKVGYVDEAGSGGGVSP
jgi:UDP-sulfoquinovose synthase